MSVQNFFLFACLFVSYGFIITYATWAKWYATYIGRTVMGLIGSLAVAFTWIAANHLWMFSNETKQIMGIVIYASILSCVAFLWIGLIVLQWRNYRKKHPKR